MPRDGGAASANGDERDVALVEARQLGISGELGIEVQPGGIAAGQCLPEIDEAAHFTVLIGAGEISVCVA